MRRKLIGIMVCIIVMICISITHINQSIGKAPENTNYESNRHSVNKENREKEVSKNEGSSSDNIHVVVNKERRLPTDYKPEDLVVPDVSFSFKGTLEKSHLRKEAAKALENLFRLANQEGIQLNAVSGYRSYDYQKRLYENNVKRKGQEHTD